MRPVGVLVVCAMSLLLSVADAAAQTQASLEVTTGTTIEPPAAIDLGAGVPGSTLVAEGVRVAWLSNDTGMDVTVAASGLVLRDGTGSGITAEELQVVTSVGVVSRERSQPVGRIAWLTGAARESATFSVRLVVPAVDPGTYDGLLTFRVIDPSDPAAPQRVARTSSGDPVITTPMEVIVQ